jgi:hypothetical protein
MSQAEGGRASPFGQAQGGPSPNMLQAGGRGTSMLQPEGRSFSMKYGQAQRGSPNMSQAEGRPKTTQLEERSSLRQSRSSSINQSSINGLSSQQQLRTVGGTGVGSNQNMQQTEGGRPGLIQLEERPSLRQPRSSLKKTRPSSPMYQL